jgi:hypothetical protein
MTTGKGIQQAASSDLNASVAADVDAAVAASAGLRLMGFSATESHATAAVTTFKIVNGATGAAAGKVIHVELAANTSETKWFGPNGIACPLGISIDWVAGLVDVTLHYMDTSPGN